MIVIVILALISVLALEGYYHYQIRQIDPVKVVSENNYSTELMEDFWVAFGEVGALGLEPLSATTFVYSLFRIASNDDSSHLVPMFKGDKVAFQISRSLLMKMLDDVKYQGGGWHMNNFVMSIWVSRNYSVTEVMNYLLDGMYLGADGVGIAEAAKYYFGKTVYMLNQSEVVVLAALMSQPSHYFLCDGNKQFETRLRHMTDKFIKELPERYGDFVFEMPEMSESVKEKCAAKSALS